MQVAITGHSGHIGSALVHHLETSGHEVRRIRRGQREGDADWHPPSGWVRDGAFTAIDAIVHLSGASIGDGRWTEQRREELHASRIGTTRLLLDHLRTLDQRPSVFVCASAVGYYGDRGDEELTEESAPGEGFLARLTQDWEAEAGRAAELGMRDVQMRSGPVLESLLPRMLLPFRLGLGGRLGNGRQWFPWVALADAVAAIGFALVNEIEGPLNVVAPGIVTNRDFTRALGRALRRPTLFPVPELALRGIFGTERARDLLLASQRVTPQRLTEARFDFAYPQIDVALAVALGRVPARDAAA